jgi:soluble lytic murein transglycosylase-like protein
MKLFRRTWLIGGAAVVVIVAGILATAYFFAGGGPSGRRAEKITAPEAPADLEKLRPRFVAGLEALQRDDGATAVREFGAFDFGSRAVEVYRLYFLAQGHQLAGNRSAARLALAKLWARSPKFVYDSDAGFNLAALYAGVADWSHAAATAEAVATLSDAPNISAAARWQSIEWRMDHGDLSGLLDDARKIVIKSPRAPQVAPALAVVRAVSGVGPADAIKLSAAERLERAVGLMRDGDPQSALGELTALEPSAPQGLREPIALNRGLALNQLHRLDESNKVLEPLTSKSYRVAIPALYTAAKNYRLLASSINPIVNKTVIAKKQVGTRKVKVGKGKDARTVTKPRFANVKKIVQLVDVAKKAKKDEYERLSTERLKDLLQLPLSQPVRLEVLNTLIGIAESKNQDEYEQELIQQAVRLDRTADPGLQHFWDKAWAAYARGDLSGAKPQFRFIADTYLNPNVRRQNDYWYARTVERLGQKEEAVRIYQQLAAAPYDDLYAIHAHARGAATQPNGTNPLTMNRPDWAVIAEHNMPQELRLAYELTALTDVRDARLEIQRNITPQNDRYANALLADLYNVAGNTDLLYRSIRRAFPELATAEQDSVPGHFLRIYYPVRYTDAVRQSASRFGVDPYLVMALILQESSYNPHAKSPVGATGLMQIMPATGKELGQRLRVPFSVARLENPDVNIELGTFHLKNLIDMFEGNAYLAVASYNAGQGNVLKWKRAAAGRPLDEMLESIPFPETRNYVKRVTMLRSSYSRIAQ